VTFIHIVPAISEEASGPSYSVVRLCDELINAGCQVELAALDWAPIANPKGYLRVFPLGTGPRRLGRSPAMARWLADQASSGRVQLLHNHSLWMLPNVYPGRVAKSYALPFVVSPRGTMSTWAMDSGSKVKRFFWPILQKPALDAVTCFHATAESEYLDIRRLGFKQPVVIIPNGVDLLPFHSKAPNEMRTLLFLGRIHPKKGLDMLLPAWRVLQDRFPDWELLIVGPDNGGYLGKVRELANDLDLRRVDFSGPLYGVEKLKAYSNADLFILPTYSENFGMSVAEALAAGTPAIVTHGAPWSGLATHKAGWWIETDLDALIASMQEAMVLDKQILAAMGRRGRDWMAREFSWGAVGKEMARTYSWLLGRGALPSSVIID